MMQNHHEDNHGYEEKIKKGRKQGGRGLVIKIRAFPCRFSLFP
jgi:hypothetical protein